MSVRIGQLAAFEALRLLDRDAFGGKILLEAFDDFLGAFILAARIEREQGFVSFFHDGSSLELN